MKLTKNKTVEPLSIHEAVLKRIDLLSREEIEARLAWTPENIVPDSQVLPPNTEKQVRRRSRSQTLS